MRHSATAPRLALISVALLIAPAWAAAASDENLLLNGDAEQGKNGMPSVWFPASVPAEDLRMWQDTQHAHAGKACLAISNQHQYDQQVCNNWAQDLQEVPVGKEIRLITSVRTEDADSVNACIQCWSADGEKMLAFTSTPVLRGTYEWTVLKTQKITVPPKTSSIIVRAVLTGKGKAFFDDLTLEVIGKGSDQTGEQQLEDGSVPAPASSAGKDLEALVSGRIVRTLPITKDCMILSYIPDWNHGEVDNLGVGNYKGGIRALLAWPNPASQVIASPNSRFLLALYSRETRYHLPSGRIELHEILKDWPERTAWSNQPDTDPKPAARFDTIGGSKKWKIFDLTGYVRQQVKSGRPNHGIMLRFDQENRPFNESDVTEYAFVSREGIGEWKDCRPMLLVVEPNEPGTSGKQDSATTNPAQPPSQAPGSHNP